MKKSFLIIPILMLSLLSCTKKKNNNNVIPDPDPVIPTPEPDPEPEVVQFSQTGLNTVYTAVGLEYNYTVTFKYEDINDAKKEIYFKFDGCSSTATQDLGIAESNMDPDGITYMADNRQYMKIDGEYKYIEDELDGNTLQNIHYFASYFQTALLSPDPTTDPNKTYWKCQDDKGEYYLDEDNKVVYKNKEDNTLKIRNDVIILEKASGRQFIKSWLPRELQDDIKMIYEIVFSNVRKTKIDITLDDLKDATA